MDIIIALYKISFLPKAENNGVYRISISLSVVEFDLGHCVGISKDWLSRVVGNIYLFFFKTVPYLDCWYFLVVRMIKVLISLNLYPGI